MTVLYHSVPLDDRIASLELPAVGTPLTAAAAKELAWLVAWRGIGHVAPNPLVGAVIVDAHHCFLAAGAHLKVGGPHAEVAAIAALPSPLAAKGGTMYVTLEPCAHSGRTPACAPQVADLGLAAVVVAEVDPFPLVDGRGLAQLRSAGISVTVDEAWGHSCGRLTEIFRHGLAARGTAPMPFVGLKVAATFDGMMGRRGDQRVAITEARARAYGHFLRLYYDAVAIGCGTLIADDPSLTIRSGPAKGLARGKTPRRLVFDPKGRGLAAILARRRRDPQATPALLVDRPADVEWLTAEGSLATAGEGRDFLTALGATVRSFALGNDGRLPLPEVMAHLAHGGVTSLLLEGGAGLYSTFLDAKLVQRLHLFQAPRLAGAGPAGLYFATNAAPHGMAVGSTTEITPLGRDWLVEMAIAPSDQELRSNF